MAKTNFSKGEEIVREAVEKLLREQLLDLAILEKGGKIDTKFKERLYLVLGLQLELKRLYHSDRKIYKKLGIKKKDLDGLLSDPKTITEEQWVLLVKLKEQADAHLKELITTSDEEIVEKERLKHITKRFNVNEKWLPLT